jgi:uroporphyrinogen III methyltransferase/synthase
MKKFLIKSGCRNSKLSLVQTENALNAIKEDLPKLDFKIIGLASFGDKNKNLNLESPETPDDIWTRELDEMLLKGTLDIAVHSAKDLPPKLHTDLDFFWLPWSEVAGDVLIFKKNQTEKDLPKKPIAAVSSERRSLYVKEKFPKAVLKPIRGTIEERIAQLDNGDFDILLMAEAALNRLHLQDRISLRIPLSDLPSPEGQGKIAITYKKKNKTALLIRDLYLQPVTFVGAGPGDPDLLTIKGQKALAHADCILYDALANPALLDFANPLAEKIFVGKRAGEHSMQQDKITELMVLKVKQGKSVLRLKGGDPSIFGRLAEEVLELKAEGIPYRIIPGISALNGATIAGGLLLTARGINQSFLTATATTEIIEKDYLKQYANIKQPVVFFMGLKQLGNIVKEYLGSGWAPTTPVAIISDSYGAIAVRGTLKNIKKKLLDSELKAPALIAIGDFASEGNDMRSTKATLNQCRVLLPGVKESVEHLAEEVERLGGSPIPWPMVQLQLSQSFLDIFKDISKFNLIVLASPASVRFFFEAVITNQLSFSKEIEFAVTGPGTALELKKFGRFPTYIPDTDFSSHGLIEKFKQYNLSSKNVLIPHSNIGGKEIEKHLSKTSFVTSAVLYQNSLLTQDKPLPDFDAILFTSPSGIKHFIENYKPSKLKKKHIAVIGKVTAAEALKYKLKINAIAKESTTKGLVKALASVLQNNKL